MWELLNLRVCDRIGTGRPKEQPFRLRKYISMVEEALRDPISVSMLNIDGARLMEVLERAEYKRLGVDTFVRPNDAFAEAQKHGMLQYTLHGYAPVGSRDVLGLGASALSQIGTCYFWTTGDTGEYARCLGRGELAIKKGLERSPEQLARHAVIASLLCEKPVSFANVESEHRIRFADVFSNELVQLQHYAARGFVELAQDSMHVLSAGRPSLQALCELFDRPGETVRRRAQVIDFPRPSKQSREP